MELKTQQDSEAFSDMETKLALAQSVRGWLRGKGLSDWNYVTEPHRLQSRSEAEKSLSSGDRSGLGHVLLIGPNSAHFVM